MITPPPDVDLIALERLVPYLRAAVAAQPVDVADQLDAALRERRTALRFEPSAAGVVVIVTVDGVDLAECDIRNLTEDISE